MKYILRITLATRRDYRAPGFRTAAISDATFQHLDMCSAAASALSETIGARGRVEVFEGELIAAGQSNLLKNARHIVTYRNGEIIEMHASTMERVSVVSPDVWLKGK